MAGKKSVLSTAKDSAIDAGVAVVGGGVVGAVAGKYALLVGAPITLWGYHTGNRYAKALGLGTMASTGYQLATAVGGGAAAGLGESENYGTEGASGFDFAAAQQGAITRVGGWFANIKGKLGIPAGPKAAAGLGEGDTNYFPNPLAGPVEYELAALGEADYETMPAGSVGNLGQAAIGNLAGGRSGTGAII